MAATDAKFQFSVKVGGNILVVGGNTREEFEANMTELFGQDGWAIVLADFDSRVKGADQQTAQSDQQFAQAEQTIQQGFGATPGLGSTPPPHIAQQQPQPDFVPQGTPPAQWGSNGGYHQPQQQPQIPTPNCQHGPMNYGKSRNSFFCPLPRDVPLNQKCTPIDAKTGKPWKTS